MKKLAVRHAELIAHGKAEIADLFIENGQLFFSQPSITDKELYQPDEIINGQDCFVTAGLFDLQVNGCPECNLWDDPTPGQFNQLCQLLLNAGVTAFLPTLITDEWQHLKKNIAFLESMGISTETPIQAKTKTTGASASKLVFIPGIHLEGPFLSPERAGVHPKEYLKPLLMPELMELARPSVRLMTLAAELQNGKQAIAYLRQQGIVPSLGHSNATFQEATDTFNWGTHIFNAMPPIHQRHPGAVIAALLAQDVYCGVICDGLHVDPNMVKLLVKLKGVDKVILVTDMASVGTTGGELVGASITLSQAVRNVVNWGIATFPEAIQMAAFNPAKAMNLDHCLGDLKAGRRADLVIWDKKTLLIKHVIAGGHLVF
jgi:N-acetylglucosamine-6-phosphate deacetylase